MKAPISYLRSRLRKILLYLRVWQTVMITRLRLSLMGYASFEKIPIRFCENKNHYKPAYIAKVVQRVSKFVPGALCLAQAVSAQRLLAKSGFETTMRIGVKAEVSGGFEAHAWLIFEEKVILGGNVPQLEQYRVITDMNAPMF